MDRREDKKGKALPSETYEMTDGRVLMTGTQALVRLLIDQARRDEAAGLRTAGFVSGYRGSPLAGLDVQLQRAHGALDAAQIRFEPGINEDLAATAVWGTQEVPKQKGANVDGVFGLWYGKAPGLDRSGDAIRHANVAGTGPTGGVLAVSGDDPLGKSSTLPCQSEQAFVDLEVPFFAPASVAEVLEYGLHGFALSRHSGLWSGMVATADTMDATATIDVSLDTPRIKVPAGETANQPFPGRLMLVERLSVEKSLRDVRLPAALDYIRANGLNRIVWDSPTPRLGIVAGGKAWMVLIEALSMMGIDAQTAAMAGIRLCKIGVPWPLEPELMGVFADGLDSVLVVESKRPLLESQLKQQLFNLPEQRRPTVVGKTDAEGKPLLPVTGEVAVENIIQAILGLLDRNHQTPAMHEAAVRVRKAREAAQALTNGAARIPYFCSGCPHSSSTNVPDGSTSLSGIGCHIMAQWMDREQGGTTHMGAEGASWIGMAPFIDGAHTFVNIGDGTYQHSGLMAIRAAAAAKAPITYKILVNDAVAMTGGQQVDGALTVDQIARQVAGEGVERVVVVAEQPERHKTADLPAGTTVRPRAEMDAVQRELREYPGVSVLIFDQVCAAEKRRRRSRGLYPDPPQRLFINDRVCEGCGDCSVKSNCISVEPLETVFGTKRQINQDSCNKDFSCSDGFCPSFVLIDGAKRKKPDVDAQAIKARADKLIQPDPVSVGAGFSMLFTGIGGTGMTAASGMLARAAEIEGLEVATLDMVGLAQKGGGVASHVRFATAGTPLYGVHLGPGQADVLIASDLLMATGEPALALMDAGRTRAVANGQIAPTADFVLHQSLPYRDQEVLSRLASAVKSVQARDVTAAAKQVLGDSIFANMMLIGMAAQAGLLPLRIEAIEQAIRQTGLAVDKNIAAFHAGRLLSEENVPARIEQTSETAAGLADRFEAELVGYQNAAYASRYRRLVDQVAQAERAVKPDQEKLAETVARNLYKLMAYKDEYEVARLYSEPAFRQGLEQQFEAPEKLSVKLAPPLLARRDPNTGRPRKMTFGPWIFTAFGVLQRLKSLRGTPFDPFGRTAERKAERALITDYEQTIKKLIDGLGPGNHGVACDIAAIPQDVRGFGPIKEKAIKKAAVKQAALIARFAPEAKKAPVREALSQAAE